MPQISLVGAYKIDLDAQGRAVGTNNGTGATTLLPTVPLAYDAVPQPLIIVNGHPNGSAGNGATIEGFVLESGHNGISDEPAGQGVFALRVHDLTVAGNILAGPFQRIDRPARQQWPGRSKLSAWSRPGSCDIVLAGSGRVSGDEQSADLRRNPGFPIAAATLIPVDTLIE